MRVSRAGVILIKSFEGFRPRAVQGADGRWTIGYGHTRSAREGLTVSEADAELLLQYDLLPVVEALNAETATPLNQHQFDALASFAFSVGVEAFRQSDVLARLNGGDGAAAAEAFAAWPEPESADVRRRRRAAERALFFADPAAPVSLAELLAAPLPEVEAEAVAAVAEPAPEPVVVEAAPSEPSALPARDARTAALAMLLGEPADPEPAAPATTVEVAPEAGVAVDPGASAGMTGEAAETEGSSDAPAVEPARNEGASDETLAPSRPEPEPEPETVAGAETSADVPPETAPEIEPESLPERLPAEVMAEAVPAPTPASPTAGLMAMQRLSPYSAVALAPLPGLQTLTFGQTPAAPEPQPEPEPLVLTPQPAPEAPPVLPPTEPRPLPEPPADMTPEPPVFSPPTVEFPSEQPRPTFVLTPPTEEDLPVMRPAWPEQERFETAGADQGPLFEEAPAASIIRHEEPGPRQGPDWSQITPFVVMFVIGLASCAFSAAAFRRAIEEPLPLDEFTIAGWALALIGVICVSVSAYSLYKRLGGSRSGAA